jgi:mono/diheme cytochrome c family protein
MKRVLSVATGILMVLSLAPAHATAAAETPTYNQDVGPILLSNCASCHRPNQIAPMPLLSYKDARPWARAIKVKVASREMPPWFADPRFGEFSNDTSLSTDEIATISAWVDAGAPEGDGPAPVPPRFSESGWSHPSGLDPDYVIDFPVEWHIDADGESPNFNLFTPLPLDDVMWVSATEVRSGNRAVTHHITTRLLNTPPGMKIGTGPAWSGGPTVDYVLLPDPDADQEELAALRKARAESATDSEGTDESEDTDDFQDPSAAAAGAGFGAYIPGVGTAVVREGQARSIRGDLFDTIVWNLHYQATGKPETARPSLGAWLANDEGAKSEHTLVLREYTSQGEQLVAPPPLTPEERQAAGRRNQAGQGLNPLLAPIPPNDGNWTVTGIGAFQDDAVIQSLFIHAHVRGRDFTYLLTYPDGREEVLLRVPNYSFDWQYTYTLAEPVKAPAGSTIKVISRYDNSVNNRLNPAPQKEVYWSEQSWDDMFLPLIGYTLVDEVKGTGTTDE